MYHKKKYCFYFLYKFADLYILKNIYFKITSELIIAYFSIDESQKFYLMNIKEHWIIKLYIYIYMSIKFFIALFLLFYFIFLILLSYKKYIKTKHNKRIDILF